MEKNNNITPDRSFLDKHWPLNCNWIIWFNVAACDTKATNTHHNLLSDNVLFGAGVLKYQENNLQIESFCTIQEFWMCWATLGLITIPSSFIESIWDNEEILSYLKNIRNMTFDKDAVKGAVFNQKIDRKIPLPNFTKIKSTSIFRNGIQPVWEDPRHLNGGMFFIKIFNNGNAFNVLWKNTVLATIGETLPHSEYITGVRANPKKSGSAKVYRIEIWFMKPEKIIPSIFIKDIMLKISATLFVNKNDPLGKNFKLQSFGSVNYESEYKTCMITENNNETQQPERRQQKSRKNYYPRSFTTNNNNDRRNKV